MKHLIYLYLPLFLYISGCAGTQQKADTTQTEAETSEENSFCETNTPADIQARATAILETYEKIKSAGEGSDELLALEKEFFCAFPGTHEDLQKIFGYTQDTDPLIEGEEGWEITQYFANLTSIPREVFYPKFIGLTINGINEVENPAFAFTVDQILETDPKNAVKALKQRSPEEIASVFRFLYDEPEIGNLDMAYEGLQKVLEETDSEIAAIHKKAYEELQEKWAKIFEEGE